MRREAARASDLFCVCAGLFEAPNLTVPDGYEAAFIASSAGAAGRLGRV